MEAASCPPSIVSSGCEPLAATGRKNPLNASQKLGQVGGIHAPGEMTEGLTDKTETRPQGGSKTPLEPPNSRRASEDLEISCFSLAPIPREIFQQGASSSPWSYGRSNSQMNSDRRCHGQLENK
jgi:hypothetical protein